MVKKVASLVMVLMLCATSSNLSGCSDEKTVDQGNISPSDVESNDPETGNGKNPTDASNPQGGTADVNVEPTANDEGSGSVLGGYCETCNKDADCRDEFRCVSLTPEESFCLRHSCSMQSGQAADCDYGSACQDLPAVGLICIPDSGRCNDCIPSPSSQEICDGLDNDCDGATDESPDADKSCDDASECTLDQCVAGKCAYAPAKDYCLIGFGCYESNQVNPNNPCQSCRPTQSQDGWSPNDGATCDDDNPCTSPDTCNDSMCAGINVDCDDNRECTNDFCDVNGTCRHEVLENMCLIEEACYKSGDLNPANSCQFCSPAQTPESKTKSLTWSMLELGTPCDDSNPCTSADYCVGTTCKGFPVVCDDDNECTSAGCSPETGCYFTPKDGKWCNDGNPCTVSDSCTDSACAGLPQNCDDNKPCTNDVCDVASGGCVHLAQVGLDCDDGTACTLDDKCNPQGECVGAMMKCTDDIWCTQDQCEDGKCVFPLKEDWCLINTQCYKRKDTNPLAVCQWCLPELASNAWSMKHGSCNDMNPCTFDTTCKNGECTPLYNVCACENDADCSDGNPCNGNEYCSKLGSPFQWQCLPDPKGPIVCSTVSDTACSQSHCNPATGNCHLKNAINGTQCDDGNACTATDVCASGQCLGQKKNCDDGNLCTSDHCNPLVGCQFKPNKLPCDDGNICTEQDYCDNGQCISKLNSCDCQKDEDCPKPDDLCAGDYKCIKHPEKKLACTLVPKPPCETSGDGPCLKTTCNPKTGQCDKKSLPNNALCDDGNECTVADQCLNSKCHGDALQCDDGNPCTVDTCKPALGCVHAPNTGSLCNDLDPCTVSDACQNGKCQGQSAQCECKKSSDCVDDGNLCNGTPVCDNSQVPYKCITDPMSVVVCTASSVTNDVTECAKPICDPATGQCSITAANDGQPCNDSNQCTHTDLCNNGLCMGTAYVCDDNLECTVDSCDGTGCNFALAPGSCLMNGQCYDQGELNSSGCQMCDTSVSSSDWTPLTGSPCKSNNPCIVNAQCTDGECIGSELVCDDKIPCTEDSCHADFGCVSVLKSNACMIESACYSTGEKRPDNPCQACVPAFTTSQWSPIDGACDDGDACTIEQCVNGTCTEIAKLNCNDNNNCTNDACDSQMGCFYSNNVKPCDDGIACTTKDTCKNGECVGKPCECLVDADCELKTLKCQGKMECINNKCVTNTSQAIVCPKSNNPCLINECVDPEGLCVETPVSDGLTCDIDNKCTDKSCLNGQCTGKNTDCDDGDECTMDSCDPKTGCVNSTIDTAVSSTCYTGFPPESEGVGECMAGQILCSTPNSCTGQIIPAAEICNQKDDDCDGETDEDTETCIEYFKDLDGDSFGVASDSKCLCEPTGFYTATVPGDCVDTDAMINPAHVEVCNDKDDNCDEMIDVGCDDDNDGYCDALIGGGPASACPKGGNDCDDENADINPGETDLPDVSMIDSDCDNLDGTWSKAVFVSQVCGNDNHDGNPMSPVKSINAGLLRVQEDPEKHYLILDASPEVDAWYQFDGYTGGISLVSGASLYGRYVAHDPVTKHCSLEWNRSIFVKSVIGRMWVEGSTNHAFGISAYKLTKPTVLQWIRIGVAVTNKTGTSNPVTNPAISVYGVHIVGGNVSLEESTILVGGAGHGASGTGGEKGSNGGQGEKGGNGIANESGEGGTGGIRSCNNSQSHSGGNGGQAGLGYKEGKDGNEGVGPSPGKEGDGGKKSSCANLPNKSQRPGKNGSNGKPGANGNHGKNATDPHGLIDDQNLWFSQNGTAGKQGHHGSGGGGGGGGGGLLANVKSGVNKTGQAALGGGGGGGGGSGACAGQAGTGGIGGGGAFGVFIHNTKNKTPVSILSSVIVVGNGGNGGNGGTGGSGGSGGNGGLGGLHAAGYCQNNNGGDVLQTSGKGGSGGRGGHGGYGGSGGGGAGGVSYGVYWSKESPEPSIITSTITHGLPGTGGIQTKGSKKPKATNGVAKPTP